MDWNFQVVSGNLTASPVTRSTTSGKHVATFTVAANRKIGDKETASFVRCVAWDFLADIAQQNLDKGTRVIVIGAQNTRSYTDNDGRKVYITELNVNQIGIIPRLDNGMKEDFRRGGNFERFGNADEEIPF